ncbi:TPA: O-antigen ligase family protein [Bacillus cereus]|uniref:O-antigen ligase family protein n=1 Tax=Bacillus cereus group TaxID=86661 RepID=UPI000A3C202C|nr:MULTISPECIES: O-antigen ligase family protein [Bacillus cereus group]KAA6462488.1 O-antigen ligase family protein [Bacillus cereus]KAB2418385.1 O-antigen ligase family protein [Bacillus cereus]KAB2438684.1 O-antigen ligase family protein [Bacillus cereus]KAB2469655.1 O-antigen ligase family protein [Bacillus cereus]MCU4840865.1 O-antigen ligase family protein [Bacillus cereus]
MKVVDKKRSTVLLFLLVFSVMLGRYSLDIGFSLKPYMIFIAFVLIFSLHRFYLHKLYSYEVMMILFYLYYSSTAIIAKFPNASFRMILGVIIIFGSYFMFKFILDGYSINEIHLSIASAGIVFNLISIILYLIGIVSLNFHLVGNQIEAYGLLMDRNTPRLVGLLSDPNLFVFYNMLFVCFYIHNLDGLKNKIGLMLSVTTCLLTFSRGAFLALFFVGVIYVLTSKPKVLFKLSFIALLITPIIFYIVENWFSIDLLSIILERANSTTSDGGSGRLDLWSRGLGYMLDSPVFGIGAFNFPQYNLYFYGKEMYMHNTFLEVLTESGLIGIMLYTIFCLFIMFTVLKNGLYKKYPYLLTTLVGYFILMMTLSVIINEALFLYLSILWKCLNVEKINDKNNDKPIIK